MALPKYLAPLKYNSILDADSYKVPHWKFYRPGTERVYSYLESRGGEHDAVMLAGLQPLLYKLGQKLEQWEIDEAEEFCVKHFGFKSYFNKKMWLDILHHHEGKLPLKIKAVPEGVLLPKRTPLVSVENTVDGMAALTSYKETMLLRDLWPACSIASRIFRMKKKINPFFERTSDNPISPFALLDFSSRGVFGYNHSEIAGAVFTFMFQGSDNIPGIRYANYYYDSEMSAHSVAAMEHSIACGFGKGNDDDYIDNCLEKAEPGSICSIVGDTWNIYEFSKKLVKRKEIIANKNLSVVPRPDSGERKRVYPEIMATYAEGFGTQKNRKGFDVINFNVKGLWADGMNEHTVIEPFAIAEDMHISADSVLTGSGGGIAAADLDRDTDKWAFKASEYVMSDGTRMDIAKDPITDPGKVSKSGRFGVIRMQDGRVETIQRVNDVEDERDMMSVRFLNGDVVAPRTLDQIRERVDAQL